MCDNHGMPGSRRKEAVKRRESLRPRALQTALLLWRLWLWLPADKKRQVLALARRHGPWLVSREFRKRRRSK